MRQISKDYHYGFTIVELLVVIVVIAILAAITIVSYTGISSKAKIATLQSDLSNASAQLKVFQATDPNGDYPTANNCPNPGTNQICLKSSNGNNFTYTPSNSTNPKTFALKSANETTAYHITDNSSPFTLDPANWLTIGTQTWAKTNLNVGTRIDGAANQTNNNGTNIIEKYCYGNVDTGCTNTDSNGIVYGGLYQWDEAMRYTTTNGAQGICPAGSHIPTDSEWKILEVQLGMTQAVANTYDWRGTDQGTQLRSGGSSGLNLPFAGLRFFNRNGLIAGLSSNASLWSSSESNVGSIYAWSRGLVPDSGYANVMRWGFEKTYGYSVRCLGKLINLC